MSSEPKRIAFFLWNVWFFRNFAGVLAELAARGHQVTIVLQRVETEPSALRALDALLERWPNLQVKVLPERSDALGPLAKALSRAVEYLYFHRPVFADKPILRIRMRHRTHPMIRLLISPFAHLLREPALRVLIGLERALPRSQTIIEAVRELRPDLAVFSPLIDVAIAQFEHVRCAQRIGVPTLFAVHSWDNLSTKSLLREQTDAVAVWNFRQVEEALSFHGVARERVSVTGAPTYDRCFDVSLTETRDQFLSRLSLDPNERTILYLSSATFGFRERPEADFARRWVAAIRSANDPRVARANIIIRPHPRRGTEWVDCQELPPGVVVFPKQGENTADEASFATYALSLSHADCVVGINTSAMIEAGIFGKPVLTVLDPSHADSQTGTFHFQYLLGNEDEGVLLRAAKSFSEHIAQLTETFDRSPERSAAARAFATAFVRPLGADVRATDRFVTLVEDLCAKPAKVSSPAIRATRMQRAAVPVFAAVSAFIRLAHLMLGPMRGGSARGTK
jgi:hypothetical protein